ncbi:thioredoxin fold domain-containing protein [Candidatus Poribacteria bacterium]|nr:thioredoxin fold domain-containing protein [Candidatus Poribacteria bacterium]MYG05594.1 thioredoxin fold domain-containing protein [Candidatus Poribacteria bacterium]MYK22745.1 thioredoxin fold domain-containing protein [Candidatus Poribacteria bacterium]
MLKTVKRHQYLFWSLLTLIAITFPVHTQAQFADFGLGEKVPVEKLAAKGYLSLDKVHPGSQFEIAVVVEIAKGWHVNANPAKEGFIATEVTLPEVSYLAFGEVVYPVGEVLKLGSIGEAPVYHDTITIGIQADLSQTAPIGSNTLDFQLQYQACDDAQCLLPETLNFSVPIEVVSIEGTVQRINETIFANIEFGAPLGTTGDEGSLQRALSGGQVWLAFLLVFAGGILTSLTPCVYPLIPITVSIFGANESAGLFKSFLLSVVYVIGIVVMYAILGVAVASTGAVFGQIMANPWVVGFISLILVTLGLSMFGVFEIRLPSAVQNRLNTVGGAGFAGAFAMGTVAGVIAAPCTGPALAVVLTYIATTGSLFLGFWLMFTYALGMGLLFIGIGTFSGLLSALPRSGGWMYILENIFGIAIITMALYFLKDVFPVLQDFLQNSLPFFAIAGCLVFIGLCLGKLTQRFSGISPQIKFQKACGLLLAVIGAYMFVGGIQQPAGPQLNWVYDEAEGFEIAKRENKLVMLDFYASWCAACNELDHQTYSDPAVAARLDDYVNVKLDFTRTSETTKALTKKYEIPGLPVVIFLDADRIVLERFTGFVNAEEMLSILDEIENSAQ